jgi:hypothetical protein
MLAGERARRRASSIRLDDSGAHLGDHRGMDAAELESPDSVFSGTAAFGFPPR